MSESSDQAIPFVDESDLAAPDLRVRVDKLFFEDESTSFYIFRGMDLDQEGKSRKVKGNFPGLTLEEDLELELDGEWNRHPDYGPTFQVDQFDPVLDSCSGIRAYLTTQVDGIRTLDASRLVDQFGTDTIERLEGGGDRISDVPGWSDEKCDEIAVAWQTHCDRQGVTHKLESEGLRPDQIEDVASVFGDRLDDILEQHPYRLMEVESIPFGLIDRMARHQHDVGREDRRRLEGMTLASCRDYSRKGHLFVERGQLPDVMESWSKRQDTPTVRSRVVDQRIDGVIEVLTDRDQLVEEGGRLYLPDDHRYEHESARHLVRLMGEAERDVEVATFLDEYESAHRLEFSDQQREALHALNEHKVLLVTGAAGTGKTTLVKAMTELVDRADQSYELWTPTGIAAKRLQDVTNTRASTVHRALGYDGSSWSYGDHQRYPVEVVVCDEVSMISQDVFYHLVSSLRDDATLVLVGDPSQLPSVGAGHVLQELIRSDEVCRIHLDHIFRQEAASDIVINAHRINEGEPLELNDPRDSETDFKFFEMSDKSAIREGLLSVVERLFESDRDHTFQVISPTYDTPIGVDRLNQEIRDRLNPDTGHVKSVKIGDRLYREGDRVMIVQNNYQLSVFNGEMGKLMGINRGDEELQVKLFDEPVNKFVDLDYDVAEDLLDLAYAISCHKSQGQEFDHILFPFHTAFHIQLQRNLLYTSLTRAQDRAFVFGERDALHRAIRNNRTERRNTIFGDRIRLYRRHLDSPSEDPQPS